MSLELFQRILDDLKQFSRKLKVMEMFNFGEPLCNLNLEKMVGMAKTADVAEKINVTTNGLLLTPARVDALVAAGIDIIRISLQGLDSETYMKMCGVKVDFDKFMGNLAYLYEYRGNCSIRMKIADIAIADLPDGEKRFKEIFGPIADTIFVEHILPIYAGVDYNNIEHSIYANAMNGRENVRQNEVHKVCYRPFYRLRVAPDGGVYAACCDAPNDIYFGSIYESNLKSIWKGVKRESFLKMQLRGERFKHPVCKDCILPNDITNEADILDPYAEEILKRL